MEGWGVAPGGTVRQDTAERGHIDSVRAVVSVVVVGQVCQLIQTGLHRLRNISWIEFDKTRRGSRPSLMIDEEVRGVALPRPPREQGWGGRHSLSGLEGEGRSGR